MKYNEFEERIITGANVACVLIFVLVLTLIANFFLHLVGMPQEKTFALLCVFGLIFGLFAAILVLDYNQQLRRFYQRLLKRTCK